MAPQSKPLSRLARSALKATIFFSLAFAALWMAVSLYPGLVILPFAGHTRRSPFCSTWQGVRDTAVKVRQGEMEKEIRAHTRLIRTENGYKLWPTPNGEFWVPDTSDQIIPILPAQRRAEESGPGTSCSTAARTSAPMSEQPWMPAPQR